MKRLASIGVALALAACATTPGAHLREGKALADAWSAFDGASTTLDALARSGALTANDKALILADGPKIRDALNAATVAYDASNDASAQQNLTIATNLIAQLVSIVKAHP